MGMSHLNNPQNVGIFVLLDIYNKTITIMKKKLILTEDQYDRLITFINETPYDKVIKNVIKVGDVIRIEYKNSTSNFKVIDATNGQIQMDNIDSGSANINYRYFISTTSLNGDDLQIKRVHKVKEKEKLQDIKSWKGMDVKDIKNIEILRGGSVVDTVDTPRPTDDKAQAAREKGQKGKPESEDFITKANDVILVFLHHLKEGNGLNITLVNGDVVKMCCSSRGGNKFSFSMEGKSNIEELNNWDTFAIELKGEGEKEDEDLYELNKNIIGTTDGGQTFNLTFKGMSGEKTKDIILKGVTDIAPTPTCNEEPTETGDENTEETVEDVRGDAEKMMKAILSDPTMKKAFYKKPSLWNMIVAAVKGGNPKGTGIGPAKQIVNKWGEAESKRKLGESGRNFRAGKRAKFEIIYNGVYMNPTGSPKDVLNMTVGKTYDAEVNSYKLGGPKAVILTNKALGITITILKPYRDLEDTFEVKIKKSIKGKTTQEIKDYEKSAILKFVNEPGSGYAKTTKTEQPKTK